MKSMVCLLLCIFLAASVSAQSIYLLKYYQKDSLDSTLIEGFFVRFNDGAGILRLKYTDPKTNATALKEVNLQEQYSNSPEEQMADEKLYFKSVSNRNIRGGKFDDVKQITIRFQLDKNTEEFAPEGIAVNVKDSNTIFKSFSDVQFINTRDLKQDFVLQYFEQTDPFYRNLFQIKTRALSIFEQKSKLILIAVANTNDPILGPSCLKDLNRTVETFSNMANFLGIGTTIKTVSGGNYSKVNVENEIKKLAPGKNDIVIFYYSGHGFRKDKDSRTFPFVDLRTKPDNSYLVNSLNMEDIFNNIKSKGARLNLVLSDCCNNSIEDSNIISTPIPAKKGTGLEWSMTNCQTLFLNPKPQSYLVTAADIGQLATSNNKFGGFFSYFFKVSMENQCGLFKTDVSWNKVFEDMKRQTSYKAEHTICKTESDPKNICEQTPIWR